MDNIEKFTGSAAGIWLVSDVVATALGVGGALVALTLCVILAAAETASHANGGSRRIVRALLLTFALFSSATGTNAMASRVDRIAVSEAEAAEVVEQSQPRHTPTPRVKPWF